jgi:hypothetical protein
MKNMDHSTTMRTVWKIKIILVEHKAKVSRKIKRAEKHIKHAEI